MFALFLDLTLVAHLLIQFLALSVIRLRPVFICAKKDVEFQNIPQTVNTQQINNILCKIKNNIL